MNGDRWLWGALLIIIIIQLTVVQYMSIGWFRPDLPLILLTFIAVRRGTFYALAASFITGLIVDLFATHYLGLSSLCYVISTFIAGKLFYYEIEVPLRRWIPAISVSTFIYSILYSYFISLNASPAFWKLLFHHALPTAIYSTVIGILWSLSPLFERRAGLKL